jgi:hypothetical protein
MYIFVCGDCRQMTHKLFEDQGGKGVSLSRFRTFLKRLQDGMLKLEFAHYDMAGTPAHTHTDSTLYLINMRMVCTDLHYGWCFTWHAAW